MKTKILFLLALCSCILHAQYNNTYDVNANNDYLYPSFNIPTRDLGSVAVSWGLDAPSTPRTDYFILTKHDASGSVVFNVRINPANPTVDGFTHVKALIETDDEGILVAGYYYYDGSFTIIPFTVKVDANGAFQWARYYPVSTSYFTGWQFNKISLCRVEDDEEENYFIVSSAESDLRSGDAAINVIKIQNNGDMIWSKKYYDVNLLSGPYSTVRDIPGDIAFGRDHGMYMITGWRQQWVFGQEDRVFFFGIDRDGNLMTNYKSLDTPGYPFGEDMIYDPNTQLWAVTYTHGNTNYSGDPNVASGIGLITIDQSLNLFLRKFYWHSEGLENYGVSIALSDSRDYVIGCFVYEDFPLQKRNPALLKVDNAGNPIFFMRYNIDDDVIFGHHCKSYNPGTGDEEYVLVAEHSNDLRAIRTDVNGDACGAVRYKPFVLDFDEEEEVFKYYPEEVGEFHDYKPSVEEIDPEYRKCSGNASSYREAALTGVSTQEESTTGVHIYPTILSTANPVLTFQNKSGAVYSVKVMDVSGKVILEETTIGKGKNTLKLDKNEALTTGIYLVQFYSADGRVSGSKKIILTH